MVVSYRKHVYNPLVFFLSTVGSFELIELSVDLVVSVKSQIASSIRCFANRQVGQSFVCYEPSIVVELY